MLVSNLGYPRIGRERTLKKLLEAYWRGDLDDSGLMDGAHALEDEHWRRQIRLGAGLVPVSDFSLYDHVLDTAAMFDLVPKRFRELTSDLQTYFAAARGLSNAKACALKKWFDTNYHYVVPEWEQAPALVDNLPLQAYQRARDILGNKAKPVVLGPFTFLKVSKNVPALRQALEDLTPLYTRLFLELEAAGAAWVQVDEPWLVCDVTEEEMDLLAAAYKQICSSLSSLKVMLQTYFGAPNQYARLTALPVHGLGLDFVRGGRENLAHLKRYGFPADKWLAAGIVNGRNIWRTDLRQGLDLVRKLLDHVPADRMWLQPSCSLLHLPTTTTDEPHLQPALRDALAFADERLSELEVLARGVTEGEAAIAAELAVSDHARQSIEELEGRSVPSVRTRVAALRDSDFTRVVPFHERYQQQAKRLSLPLFPSTTIGSFPQTKEVRQQRARLRRGECSTEQYQAFIRGQIAEWIGIQEDLGLDVLVHGEFERNDMVEYFATSLRGCAVTANGWVQSYGSRCAKPPILYGDVYRDTPLTVAEAAYAQSLTSRPVKAILTGPITMINWSFVREDLGPDQIAYQIALAIRDEITDLEKAGLPIVQVDEPAIREGLPLRIQERPSYLSWAVRSFCLATAGARPETQVHTHMCYSEFGDIIEAISALDADVISIETARGGDALALFKRREYPRDVGLGVFDVHTPHTPEIGAIMRVVQKALELFPAERLWVNPDCGLKTRTKQEAVAALTKMVEAARRLRAEHTIG